MRKTIKKNKGGRPPKYSKQQLNKLIKAFEDYIEFNDIPIIAEFAIKHNVTRTYLYERDEFMTLLKKAIRKKISGLERNALNGKVNVSMAIFSLKQLGWSDKKDITHHKTLDELFPDDE